MTSVLMSSSLRSVDLESDRTMRASGGRQLGFPTASLIDKRMASINEDENFQDEPPFQFNLGDPLQDEETALGRLRNKVGRAVNSFYVQFFMLVLIIVNAILLGVLTLDSVRFHDNARRALETLDLSILITFTVEFACQLFYLGPILIGQTWLVFDMVVVVFSWIFLGTGSVLRAFRIFRVFSLASKWTAMQQLFAGIGRTLPKLSIVAGMLLLLFYGATVFCTHLFASLYDEGYVDYDYFGRLDLTFITLFQMLTTDTWLVIVRQVMDRDYWSYWLFFGWVTLTSIIILNLIIAIICDGLVDTQQDAAGEKDAKKIAQFQSRVPIEQLIRQQREIDGMQAEMELAINALMLRVAK